MSIRYNFIEVGTSDFMTMIQSADDETVGLSIEPISEYLNRLPNKPKVQKVNAALSNSDDFIEIYHIDSEDLEKYNLPYWIRGCNSVNGPHEFTKKKIGEELYNKLVKIDKVPTISWKTLVERCDIGSIDYLKIDTEGHEHVILRGYIDQCKLNPLLFASKIEFEYNETSNKVELDKIISELSNYDVTYLEEDVILNLKHQSKYDKSYVLYSTENYFDIITECAKSIREFSKLPIIVYLINSNKVVEVENTKTVNWNLDIEPVTNNLYIKENNNFYIDRKNPIIYKILIQRPLIIKDALNKYSNTVCYVDSDSVATPLVDSIFSYFDKSSTHPYFVEGIYEFLRYEGRGGGGPAYGGGWESTLEHNACVLFGVDQSVRKYYRQTGYFVAGQNNYDFLEEWYWMCNHPKVLKNISNYAPYDEETISNVLLWKYKIEKGLPYIYVNGSVDTVRKMYKEVEYKGTGVLNFLGSWLRAPEKKEHLLFFHGEKNPQLMKSMVQEIKKNYEDKLRVLFLAPHLSTGGMPSYLLKRIESLQKYNPEVEIYVVEYCLYSTWYVVQKEKIKEIIPEDRYWTLNTLGNHSDENSLKLIQIIKDNSIDIVHVDEILEGFDSFNRVSKNVLNALFDNDRTWKIVETCHNIYFNPKDRHFHPDAYAFCSPYHPKVQFKEETCYNEFFEFPIERQFPTENEKIEAKRKLGFDPNKIHVINVGLWTQGKNQGEGIEIAKLLQGEDIEFHFIGNQASNFKDYWEPLMFNKPSNIHIWGERNDVSDFMKAADIFLFNSTLECNPLVLREAASYGLKILSRNLPQYYDMFTPYIVEIDNDLEKTAEIIRELKQRGISRDYEIGTEQSFDFATKHKMFYEKVKKFDVRFQQPIKNNLHITQYFIKQPFLEIRGESSSKFLVQFMDEKGKIHYENRIDSNCWVKLNREYFTNWRTKVFEGETLIYDYKLNFKDKRVLINFDSRSLGDNIAWVPYALEFQKKHDCKVIVSTFWNKLFKEVYPELVFEEPGTIVKNIHAQYSMGWFYNENMEPELPNTIPLQKSATNILGLEFQEIKPRINYNIYRRPYEDKYITIATNSTAGCKFWTKEAWQELIDYLVSLGYKIVNVSKEKNDFKNVSQITDSSIGNTMNVIHHSEFFIGLSSGLSWLSWAMGKHVVMISNFTEPDHEFTSNCTRIINKSVCNGCWNNPDFKFDKGDWYWCPVHKGTPRQFECHTSITSKMVIDQIQHLLK
jgi:autotransporter strand-loop-strand O-heptosyltransferase